MIVYLLLAIRELTDRYSLQRLQRVVVAAEEAEALQIVHLPVAASCIWQLLPGHRKLANTLNQHGHLPSKKNPTPKLAVRPSQSQSSRTST